MAKGIRERTRCSVPSCERFVKGHGFCEPHYRRWKRYGNPTEKGRPGRAPIYGPRRCCSIAGCVKAAQTRGWCRTHYSRFQRWGNPEEPSHRRVARVCVVTDCARPVAGHGFCVLHYERWRKTGDPLKVSAVRKPKSLCDFWECPNKAWRASGLCKRHHQQQLAAGIIEPSAQSLTPEQRLLRLREIDVLTGCWNWMGHLQKDGAGRLTITGQGIRQMLVYRLAYTIWIGPLAPGEVVHHKCANRRCFNPEHLESATRRTNGLEMLERRSLKARIDFLEARVKELEGMLDASSEPLSCDPVASG